jgi:hypothetical protein
MPNWAIRLIAIVVVAFCLFIQFKTSGGWFTILGIFLWPVAGLIHLVAHSIRLPRSGGVQGSRLALVMVSHLLFIAAFLLQYDQGDGLGWLTITELLGQRGVAEWWPPGELNPGSMNVVLFLPVLATWVLLIIRRQPS